METTESLASSASSASTSGTTDALQLFANYPFATDSVYQQEEKAEILRRTQVFYFNRMTGYSVTVDEVRSLERPSCDGSSASSNVHVAAVNQPEASDASGEAHTLSFAELKTLIEQGKTDQIPNNRVIPNELSSETPSESIVPRGRNRGRSTARSSRCRQFQRRSVRVLL
ncbi:hypothetical protein A0H81_13589 [Grifola frondosa]|uniref:Peroxisomal membrane protein PEX14-like KPWE domain-containing protein n=1 Tax=Grifola frondosa TaxID=5627 RepID=A0A1C7LQS0_GRIFR|nr:hypothetical protein A0H81_13589 [Grifola frondosa]